MQDIFTISEQGILLVVLLSAPALITAIIIGVLVSLVQAVMQIQDQTLPFSLKLIGVVVCILATGQWIGSELMQFARYAFGAIVNY